MSELILITSILMMYFIIPQVIIYTVSEFPVNVKYKFPTDHALQNCLLSFSKPRYSKQGKNVYNYNAAQIFVQ